MRIHRLPVIALLILGQPFTTDRGAAQEPPPSQFEHIRGLEPFVGFWRGEAPPAEGGIPMSVICRLTSNRSYLQIQVATQVEGQRETIGTMLIGQDFAKGQVSVWGFWGDQQTHGKVDVGDGVATWTETGVRSDGSQSTGHVEIKVNGDQMTVDLTQMRRGDQAAPDMHMQFTRSERRGRAGRGL